MMYLDEFGTIQIIEGVEMTFYASRFHRASIVAIIQFFAQLQKSYGKEIYAIADKGNRKVSHANKSNLKDTIVMLYSILIIGDKLTEV